MTPHRGGFKSGWVTHENPWYPGGAPWIERNFEGVSAGFEWVLDGCMDPGVGGVWVGYQNSEWVVLSPGKLPWGHYMNLRRGPFK